MTNVAGETVAPDLQDALRVYLTHRYMRGQFDRCVGYSEAGARERAATLLDEYVRDQERKWDEFGPLVDGFLRRKPQRILDVGSSVGQAALVLNRRYPEARIVGCEIEPEAASVARRLTYSRPGCEFILGAIEDLGCKDGTFDFVHCSNVLEHVNSPSLAVKRMVDLLAPGGVLMLGCPNYLFPYEGHVQCWMLPGGPPFLLKLRMRLLGQDPGFVDTVRLDVNIIRVKRWLREAGPVEWLDLNDRKIDSILMGNRGGLRAPRLTSAIKTLGLGRSAAWLMKKLPIAPSVALLVRKTP